MDENQKDIDAAIDAAEAEENKSQVEATGKVDDAPAVADAAADATTGEGEAKGEAEAKPTEAFAPDDALVERAVKAGLSLADARSFTSKDSMERILTALEATASKPEEKNEPEGGDEVSAADGDPFADVDLDEIDENIVKAMKSMAAQNAAMRKEIETLKMAGESAKAQDRFSQLVGTLDESVRKGMDAATRSHLKKQYDILSAGYKAMNVEKKDSDIFDEAAKLAIGDRLTESAALKRADALEKRKNLALAKPGGEGGAGKGVRTAGEEDDPAAIAAAEIRQELGI